MEFNLVAWQILMKPAKLLQGTLFGGYEYTCKQYYGNNYYKMLPVPIHNTVLDILHVGKMAIQLQ